MGKFLTMISRMGAAIATQFTIYHDLPKFEGAGSDADHHAGCLAVFPRDL